jgi:hypothetical protein
MATPLPIPQYGVTGGGYWPAGQGTIPIADPSDYYSLTDDTAVSGAWLLQATSNPGVDPIVLYKTKALGNPTVRGGVWFYIPSLNTLHLVDQVRFPVDGYGADGTTATVVFARGHNPVGMVAATDTEIRVINYGIQPLQVTNTGGADADVNGQAFINGQSEIISTPVTYDSAGTQLSINMRF